MSGVERRFDAETGRWLLRAVDLSAVTEFIEIAPGVWIANDAAGRLAECLVSVDSAETVPADIRDMIERELAWIPPQPAGTDIVTAAAGGQPATTTIHEPGIPYVDRDGAVLVSTEGGTVRVKLSDSVLMIDVPVHSSHEWVRISDADTGHVLALGRVQKFGDGFGANVTFALDGSDIHIALTDTPLDPVADRRTRRSQWLDEVLAGLSRQWWRHPLNTREAARDAVQVARSLGDTVREARARRFMRIAPFSIVLAGLLTAGATGAAALALSGLPGEPPRLMVAGATSAVYDFGDSGSVTVSAGINTDGTVGLVVSDTLIGRRRFGPDPSRGTVSVPALRAACRESKSLYVEEGSVPAVTAKYAVSLRAADGESVLLGTVEMSSEASSFSSIDESCLSAPVAGDGSITADVVYGRSTEEFVLPPPTGSLANADTWQLSIEKVAPGPNAVTGVSRQPIVLRSSG